MVDSQITALNRARLASVNWVASSVASTVKLFCVPSCWIAVMPAGIESCRNPAVLLKTSTEKSAAMRG